jgi:2-oxo-4-hydroxy-4-carboxy-5-ureidoimidazoline decarboxylase
MTLSEFNALSVDAARAELLRCCGSTRWASDMLRRRPFADKAAAFAAADAAWAETGADDRLEAFAQHPRIGGKDALRAKFAATKAWAQGEQAAVAAADEATLDALEKGNADYEARFGRIFIVCAAGKSAPEMLALLQARLANEPKAEEALAAAEQAKITKIRMEKLLT